MIFEVHSTCALTTLWPGNSCTYSPETYATIKQTPVLQAGCGAPSEKTELPPSALPLACTAHLLHLESDSHERGEQGTKMKETSVRSWAELEGSELPGVGAGHCKPVQMKEVSFYVL